MESLRWSVIQELRGQVTCFPTSCFTSHCIMQLVIRLFEIELLKWMPQQSEA